MVFWLASKISLKVFAFVFEGALSRGQTVQTRKDLEKYAVFTLTLAKKIPLGPVSPLGPAGPSLPSLPSRPENENGLMCNFILTVY